MKEDVGHAPSRRRLLAAGFAAGAGFAIRAVPATAAIPPSAPAAPIPAIGDERPLKDIAGERGIVYGAAVMVSQVLPCDRFACLLEREAAAIVPENEMKWAEMIDAEGRVDYTLADRLVEFAQTKHLAMRGHNILWYWRTPRAFLDLTDRKAARRAMLQRIADMAGRYRGRIDSWDVVNEPVHPVTGRPDDLRPDVFYDQVGPDYLELAYRAAREADPTARLVLNDYNVEYDTPWMDRKRAAVLRVCERLLKAGAPLDALGVEAHLVAGGHPFSARKLRDFFAEIAGMGLEIQITELDCSDALAPADPAARDLLVAAEYRRFLEVALDETAVKMLITWGLSDRYSWIVRHECNEKGQRTDGMAERPLPFDRDLEPKIVQTAVADCLAHAPRREMAEDRRRPNQNG